MTTSKTKLERWEDQLKIIFDEIDVELQAKYGDNKKYRRHPNRPPAFATNNREDDGLFDLGAAFTVGYGSRHGPGYIVQARIATLDSIPSDIVEKFETEVVRRLKEKLPKVFPGVELFVDRDGPVYKIHGDLSLGRV